MNIDIKASRAICDAAKDALYGSDAESKFRVHARTALPAALDEIERLRAALLPFAAKFAYWSAWAPIEDRVTQEYHDCAAAAAALPSGCATQADNTDTGGEG